MTPERAAEVRREVAALRAESERLDAEIAKARVRVERLRADERRRVVDMLRKHGLREDDDIIREMLEATRPAPTIE